MRRIVDYRNITSGDLKGLKLKVNESIKEGWQPQSGAKFIPEALAGYAYYFQGFFLQTMVKYSPYMEEPARKDTPFFYKLW